jgi:hypothetical protein
VTRGVHVGFSFGGEDSEAHGTNGDGRFLVPARGGINRLVFECPGGGRTSVFALVWRGGTPRVTAKLAP